jgi:hypothetical protein
MTAMAGSGVKHELSLVATVAGIAIAIALAVTFLPMLGRASPGADIGATQYRKAHEIEDDDPEKALTLYESIGPDAGEWYERAKGQIARLKTELAERPPAASAEEQAAYDALADYWRKEAGNHDELIRRGEEFVRDHPRGFHRPDVERRIAHARQGRIARRQQEAQEIGEAIDRSLQRKDFAGAIQSIEASAPRLRTDLEVWSRLTARRDAVVTEARRHYQQQIQEAERLVREGLKDDARRLWLSTLRSFGDGKVPELADLHRAAALRAEEIRP